MSENRVKILITITQKPPSDAFKHIAWSKEKCKTQTFSVNSYVEQRKATNPHILEAANGLTNSFYQLTSLIQ